METTHISISNFFDMPVEDLLSITHSYVLSRRFDQDELARVRLTIQHTLRTLGNQVAEDLIATVLVAAMVRPLEADFNMASGTLVPAFARHRLSQHPREEVDVERHKLLAALEVA